MSNGREETLFTPFHDKLEAAAEAWIRCKVQENGGEGRD